MLIKFTIPLVFLFCVDRGLTNCDLSFRNDLTYNQPLLVSNTGVASWHIVQALPHDAVEIRRDESVRLVCPGTATTPNSFAHFPNRNTVLAKCSQGQTFTVDSRSNSFDKLQCKNQVKPSEKRTYLQCFGQDTELLVVGYQVENDFLGVYEVCFNKQETASIFAKVVISPYLNKNTVVPNKSTPWTTNTKLFNDMNILPSYTCEGQSASFKAITGKSFLKGNCCYDKGQLVSDEDLIYGPQQTATYHYLNAIPQYSTCSHVNWKEVENRVRKLAENLQTPLTVWTGQFRKVRGGGRLNLFHYDLYLHYISDKEFGVPVPQFIWKVVYDPKTQLGVAIIQINQDVTLTDLDNLVLCRDICDNINWLNFLPRKTIAKGYVYCCDINDFEFAFGFRKDSPLPATVSGVLRDSTRTRW